VRKQFNYPIIFLIVISTTLAAIFGCAGSGNGETAVIKLELGANPGKAISIGELRHVIAFSGPTGTKTYNVSGAGSISVAVVPGQWQINVQGYYGEELYSTGSSTVDVKAGQSTSVTIQMIVVWTDFAGVPNQAPPPLPVLIPDETVNDWTALQAYIYSLTPSGTEPIVTRTIMLDDLGDATAFAANFTINIPDTTLTTGQGVKVALVVPENKTVTITRGSLTGNIFNVEGNGTLTLGNLAYPQNSTLTLDGAGPSVTESLISVGAGSALNMYAGVTLRNNDNTTADGGAVNVAGTFNMYGGTIGPDNKAISGGGVYVDDGVFNLDGGDIKGNEASTGGGVYADATSSSKGLYMTGGTIGPDNVATLGQGGGVYIYEAEIIMSNGEIIGNKALPYSGSAQGGGVYLTHTLSSAFKFEMSGTAKINGNFAIDAMGYGAIGGGVMIASGNLGQLKMEGSAEICNNTAQASGSNPAQGGGVYFYRTSATFDMVSGTPKINGNTAVNDTGIAQGGGVYMEDGTFTMSAGEINGNTADGINASGGGVYVDIGSGASFTKSGGTILPNIIQYSGGPLTHPGFAVYVNGSPEFGCDGPVLDGVSTSPISGAWDF